MSRRRTFVVALAFSGLLFSGSAAAADPPAPPLGILRGTLASLGLAPAPGEVPEVGPLQRRFVFPPLRVAGGPPQGALAGLAPGSFAGYGSGTVYHADAGLSGPGRFTDVELGFSGAIFSGSGLPARTNELRRPLSPALAAGYGYGVGNAVEAGFNQPLERDGQLELDDKSEAKAPPSGKPISKRLERQKLGGITDADLLVTGASARAVSGGCVVGSDLASGFGELTNTKVVQQGDKDDFLLASSAKHPTRGVSRSLSRTRLTTLPGRPLGLFGLMAETRQTIAPITVLEGTDREFTIEVAGEWVLRAFADGAGGTVTFGPDIEDQDRPLLRVFDKTGKTVDEVTLDAFLAKDGAGVELADGARIILGEDPRAIGGEALSKPLTTRTLTAAAVDVLRIQVINQGDLSVSELRVGHMEAGVAVPAGGIRCPGIGMVKESDPPTVDAGDVFTWKITVSNPNDCVLDGVKIIDTVKATPGIDYEVLSTSPRASVSGSPPSKLTFDGLGPIPFGASRTVTIRVKVDGDARPGRFSDTATATGACGPATVAGDADVETPVAAAMQGGVSLEAPEVVPVRISSVTGAARELPAEVAGSSGLRPAPAGGSRPAATSTRPAARTPRPSAAAGPGTIARTGGVLGILPAIALLGTGRLLRYLRKPQSRRR